MSFYVDKIFLMNASIRTWIWICVETCFHSFHLKKNVFHDNLHRTIYLHINTTILNSFCFRHLFYKYKFVIFFTKPKRLYLVPISNNYFICFKFSVGVERLRFYKKNFLKCLTPFLVTFN